ncbi:unnamed protein product [Ixodes hexagonus]
MDCMNTYACSRCHQRTHSLAALFRHFCTRHGTESNWNCNWEGCAKTLRRHSSFRKHVSRQHKQLLLQVPPRPLRSHCCPMTPKKQQMSPVVSPVIIHMIRQTALIVALLTSVTSVPCICLLCC